jgi:hypothetical protein
MIATKTSRRIRWAGHVARMGEMRNAYKILVGVLEGKRPLRRPIILKCVLERAWGVGLDSSGSR